MVRVTIHYSLDFFIKIFWSIVVHQSVVIAFMLIEHVSNVSHQNLLRVATIEASMLMFSMFYVVDGHEQFMKVARM